MKNYGQISNIYLHILDTFGSCRQPEHLFVQMQMMQGCRTQHKDSYMLFKVFFFKKGNHHQKTSLAMNCTLWFEEAVFHLCTDMQLLTGQFNLQSSELCKLAISLLIHTQSLNWDVTSEVCCQLHDSINHSFINKFLIICTSQVSLSTTQPIQIRVLTSCIR